ncbi:ABC transporter ATP-binding protein [Alkalithermobacter paradoxus]|uniref:ABC transporter ATP-binding protein YtrB n=1 Tax=Alkalithermobacter paradoxus TaxID=29349 RepID=A0A1V4I7E1_9FIRM|nr:ABC transporter ATP-binding protein YtrB [[Clostridium] thermoalcaliphilum]
MYALEIENLCKDFGNFGIKNISLKLPVGFILGYVGQNGAGKTTTIKLIMEQIKKDSGEIRVFGKKYTDDEVAFKDMIGFISDENYFPGTFTTKDIVKTMKSFYTSFDEKKFKAYIEKWKLPEGKMVKNFSKGMKMKLMFASVLSRETKLLILDEPTGGLDPVIRIEILEELQNYISDGNRSVIFSTHIMSDLEKVADYLFFINEGKMIFNDTKDNILEGFLLIKGGSSELTPQIEKRLIGFKKSTIGFTGLINVNEKENIGKCFLTEKPSLEDIVVFHING